MRLISHTSNSERGVFSYLQYDEAVATFLGVEFVYLISYLLDILSEFVAIAALLCCICNLLLLFHLQFDPLLLLLLGEVNCNTLVPTFPWNPIWESCEQHLFRNLSREVRLSC